MSEKITAILVFEILGKPADHLVKALNDYVDSLASVKGIKIEKKRIFEPKAIEEEGSDLFTTFAEVEIIFDDLNLLFSLVHNRLPSSIEIIKPENLNIKNFELNDILSDLTIKLHKYDEVAKTIVLEKNTLIQKIQELEGKNEEHINKKEKNIKNSKKKKN
ncbi:MAG: hypothetical protein WC867_02510 [Candidatus Pacearchaeota archaeon]|jgi:hypothetical protein